MGFSKIRELSDLLAVIPSKVLTPTQRLTLHIINGYTKDEDKKGACWVGHYRLQQEIGVRKDALNKLLHELGDGYVYRDQQRRPCNRNCKRHLNLVGKRIRKARIGTRQAYFVNWDSLRELSSLYHSEHLQLERLYPGSDKGLPEYPIEVTGVNSYKHNKDNKHLVNESVIEEFLKLIPKDKQEKLGDLTRVDELISEYRTLGGLSSHLVEVVNFTAWDQIRSPRHYLIDKLEKEIDSFVPTW